jgi:hypothetical protein
MLQLLADFLLIGPAAAQALRAAVISTAHVVGGGH